jgi:tetratricopeptide (TPR) repeat protein
VSLNLKNDLEKAAKVVESCGRRKMIDPNKKDREPIDASDVCHRAFELIGAKQYSDAEKLLANNMARSDDDASIALFHSVMGVLFKVQGEYKTAWRHYERAEKLLPNDPALKIISARLLIDEFAEYSQAIKKAKKVLELVPANPVFVHQAYTTMGLAYVKKGDRKKAVEMLEKSVVGDFEHFITSQNIDFHLVEALLKKGAGVGVCREFLRKAKTFAEKANETNYISLLDKMLKAFDVDFPQEVEPEAKEEVVGEHAEE